MTLHWPTEMGTWVWNAQSLIWVGATPVNLEVMWSPRPVVHDNHAQPGVDGRLPRDGYGDELQVDVDFLLSGLVLPNGDPAPNVGYGIAANYAQLVSRVGDPSTWPTRKGVSTTVVRSDGVDLTGVAQGQVSPLGRRQGSVGTATVTVTIPAGALTETGS